MAVSGIILEANAYHPFDNIEDIAIGALLHDAIEDQDTRSAQTKSGSVLAIPSTVTLETVQM